MSEQNSNSDKIPAKTTPTWEMELLISGATVFSLLQLPAPVYRWLSIASQGHDSAVHEAIKIFSVYVQFSLWILIATFVLHLFMRGYWIALVGMSSVFPSGIQWEKIKGFGPVYKKGIEKNNVAISELIEAADNRATIVFGLGFGVSTVMITLSIAMAVVIAVLLVLQALRIGAESQDTIFLAGAIMLIAPFLVAYVIDQYFGEKLINSNRTTWLELVFAFYNKIGLGRNGSALINLYRTNQTRRKSFLFRSAMVTLGAASSLILMRTGIDSGAYKGLPSTNSRSGLEASTDFYASSRQLAESREILPYIESPIVSGPYMQLFVPYLPWQYNPILLRECPQVLTKKAANEGSGLNCLSKLLQISIDGKLIAIELVSSSDPATGQRGVIAVIPTQDLASGRHEVSLVSLQHDEDDSDKPDKEIFIRIPFWK